MLTNVSVIYYLSIFCELKPKNINKMVNLVKLIGGFAVPCFVLV